MLGAKGQADQYLKIEQLRLLRNSSSRNVPDCGHNVHLARPDVVAEEVRLFWSNFMPVRRNKSRVDFRASVFIRLCQVLGLS